MESTIRSDEFSAYHPIVNFTYFTSVLLISMFVMHPLFILTSLFSAVIYSVYLGGQKAWRFNIVMIVPTLILMALINPTFNHRGQTILFYANNNPITLESIVYGVVTAAMFVSVILWFSCYNSIMTSDKFIYLFGKLISSLSLIFSMCLRFVPRFKAQIKVIANAQKCMGRDLRTGSILKRLKHSLEIVSILTTWALENSIETADSMKSRGYGLKGRTAFSNYSFQTRDFITISLLIFTIAVVIIAVMTKTVYALYIPRILINDTNVYSICAYLSYFILCNLPMTINLFEDCRWKLLRSKQRISERKNNVTIFD